MKVLDAWQGRPVPWKNGLGTSREIAASTRQASNGSGAAVWQVSTTSIERDCPFSAHPGMQRTIMLLTGVGFELDSQGNGKRRLQAPFESCTFSGGWDTSCRLLDGPVTVLNVMVSQGDAAARVTVLRSASIPDSGPIDASARLLHVLRGAARIGLSDSASTVSLTTGQSLLVGDPAAGRVELVGEDAVVMRLDIDAPGERG